MNLTTTPCLGCLSDAQPVLNGVATVNAFVTALTLISVNPKAAATYFAAFCGPHRHYAIESMLVFARQNGLKVPELTNRLTELFGIEVPFLCPKCGAVSDNPNDKREGYCARCHAFAGEER